MVERPDVYNEFRKSGLGFNWTWDRGRREGDGMRNDGNPIGNATAAEYAESHYNNFGRREGMQLHDRTDDSYEQKLRAIDGGGGGPGGSMQSEMMSLIESLQKVIDDPKSTKEEVSEAIETTQTILTSGMNLDEKKKKSLLTPITGTK
jgi:hypothetical protein